MIPGKEFFDTIPKEKSLQAHKRKREKPRKPLYNITRKSPN